MKTILKLVLATVLCVVSTVVKSNTNPMKDPYHLTVEGKFLAEKKVAYTVYKQDSRGVFVSESRGKSRNYYSFLCDVGCKYIISFRDRHGNTKFLMIDVTKPGYFGVDVDFSKKNDAQLKYNKHGYYIYPLTDNPVAQK